MYDHSKPTAATSAAKYGVDRPFTRTITTLLRSVARGIGASLLVRSGRTVTTTEAGERILARARARAILQDVDDRRGVANGEAGSG
jgi:DNA-binding transcriptional LysR family regulator